MIDDDRRFLTSLVRRHKHTLLCRPFDQPEAAVAYIQAATPPLPRQADCLVPETDVHDSDWIPWDRTVTLKSSRLSRRIYEPERFTEVSVAIVDYDLPEMDGLEVCRQLRNLPVKTLMLTGKADAQLGASALNDGLIDGFLLKSEACIAERIETTVRRLQTAYFANVTMPLRTLMVLERPSLLSDPAFESYAHAVLDRVGAVEYYLSANPPGLLMAREDGSLAFLLMQDEAALLSQWEMAVDCGLAPASLIERLTTRDCQPWFPTECGFYDSSCLAWEKYFYPVERVGNWSASLIERNVEEALALGPILSCADYRARHVPRVPEFAD